MRLYGRLRERTDSAQCVGDNSVGDDTGIHQTLWQIPDALGGEDLVCMKEK